MRPYLSFFPIVLFVLLFVGSGVTFTLMGVEDAFYQLSPVVAILPPIFLAWIMNPGTTQERMHAFLDGVRHRDIITMCMVFLLGGAFGQVTKAIGSVDATVNLGLSLLDPSFLLVGIFLIAAFISTAIGTSMGTIAAIAPIAAGLVEYGAFSAPLGMATVVGGAMFGDNLSIISDTTLAAVLSQEANLKEKFLLNAKIALIAAVLTGGILIFATESGVSVTAQDFDILLVTPYLLLIGLAVSGINVFIVLIAALLYAGVLGLFQDLTFLAYAHNIAQGFSSIQEIMLLSLMVGGLSGLVGKESHQLILRLSQWTAKRESPRIAQLIIAKTVSVLDLLLANNTVSIIFVGEMARDLSKKCKIPPHVTATWLDTFSCVFQGIIPYGAQILLASSIAGVSPLTLVPHVYYCYALGGVALAYILWGPKVRA